MSEILLIPIFRLYCSTIKKDMEKSFTVASEDKLNVSSKYALFLFLSETEVSLKERRKNKKQKM